MARRTMGLGELRKMVGMTQMEVSAAMGLDQPELSRVERRADHYVSTLRRYVEALGGTLEVGVRIGGKTIILKAV